VWYYSWEWLGEHMRTWDERSENLVRKHLGTFVGTLQNNTPPPSPLPKKKALPPPPNAKPSH